MKHLRPLLGFLLLIAATSAHSAERVKAYYPEGPLVVDDGVIYAEMHRDRVMIWRGEALDVFYERPGCGPTAVAPYGEDFIVVCHIANEVHIVSREGQLEKRIDNDREGRPFVNPNDATADEFGGVYFSASGVFAPNEAPAGAINYVNADGEVRRLAYGLHYANGAHYDPARKLLFVSEHLGGRILSYPVLAPGRLGRPAVFVNLAGDKRLKRDPLAGPDGLEADGDGNLYAALYGLGAVLVIARSGEIIERIKTPEKLVTNLALSDDEQTIIITGSKQRRRKPYPGAVRKIDNPLKAQ